MTSPIVLGISGWAFHALFLILFVGVVAGLGRRRIDVAPWEGIVLFVLACGSAAAISRLFPELDW